MFRFLFLKIILAAHIALPPTVSASDETCVVSARDGIQPFRSGGGSYSSAAHVDDCYRTMVADGDACTVDIWRRPRFVALLKRVDDTFSKLKIVTNEETIEVERLISERAVRDRKLLRVVIDGQRIPYDDDALARTVVGNLCTIRFADENTVVELANTDFWLRFNGSHAEFRARGGGDERVCGMCAAAAADDASVVAGAAAKVRSALAAGGFLKDEHEKCRIRAADAPDAKCEVSASDGLRPFYSNSWQNATVGADCYVMVAADADACSHSSRRPRFTVLIKRIDETFSKVKLVTDAEVIELEREVRARTPRERRLLAVRVDGQRLPYDAYAMARSVVDNLCTVEFMRRDNSVVELQNADVWLRFDGAALQVRALRAADVRAGCGMCAARSSESAQRQHHHQQQQEHSAQLREALAAGGFLADESPKCGGGGKDTVSADQATVAECINEFVRVPDDSNDNDSRDDDNDSKLENKNELGEDYGDAKTSLYEPRPMTLVEEYPRRVCWSERAVLECDAPTAPLNATRAQNLRAQKRGRVERVRFACVERARAVAQELLNLAYRRRFLQKAAARSSGAAKTRELCALEKRIGKSAESAKNADSSPEPYGRSSGFTTIHRIPAYCTLNTI